jgi:hypothetical protein
MRMLLSVLMALHGFAHLPGFVHGWELKKLEGFPYTGRVMNDSLHVGDLGMRILGTAWLLTAAAFMLAAGAAFTGRPGWVLIAGVVAAISSVLCVLAMPRANVGLAVNVGILVVLGMALKLGWI